MISLFYKNEMKNYEVCTWSDFPFIISKIDTPVVIMAQIQLLFCSAEDKGNSSNTEDLRKINMSDAKH